MTRPLTAADGGAALGRDRRANDGATRLAERALLDALRAQPDRIRDVAGWLAASDFVDAEHGGVYATLVGLLAAGELRLTDESNGLPDDPSGAQATAAVHNELALRNALVERRFTDTAYPDHRQLLADIADTASIRTSGQHARYARMILESSVRRQLGEWAVRLERATTQPAEDRATAPTVTSVDLAMLEGRVARSRGELPAPVSTTLGAVLPASATAALNAAPSPKLVLRAERQIIATTLDPHIPARELIEQLTPDDFTADPAHAETWRAIQALSRRGEPVDAVTVAWELDKAPADATPSGLPAESLMDLGSLAQRDPSRALNTVTRAALAHRARIAVHAVQELARDRNQDLSTVLASARQIVGNLDEHAARLATSAEDSRSTISRALDHTDEPAVRPATPTTPQPGRWR